MPFKLLTIWLITNLLFYPLNKLCIAIYHNNILWYHIQSTFEYSAYAIIYYHLFINRRIKQIVLYSIPIVVIFSIINGCFFQHFTKTFPSYLVMPEHVIYVVFATLLFKQMLQYPVQMNIMKQSVFWFNTGVMFFSTTMFLTLSLSNNIAKYPREEVMLILYFWYSIDIIFSTLLLIAILNDNNLRSVSNGKQ
jgi:hypothetical protein